MKAASKFDKRRFERFEYPDQLTSKSKSRFVSFFQGKKRIVKISHFHDISESGISFEVEKYNAPKIGERIGIEFEIPGSRKVACFAEVIWLEQLSSTSSPVLVRVGIKFANLPPKFEELLHKGLADYSKQTNKKDPLDFLVVHFDPDRIETVLKHVALIMIGLIGAYFIVSHAQKVAQSKWWVDEAYNFAERIEKNKAATSEENNK